MKIVPLGDSALEVRLGHGVSPEVNDRVVRWCAQIEDSLDDKILYVIATYNTLCIGFDPLTISYEVLKDMIDKMPEPPVKNHHPRVIQVPVCYDHCFGLDWDRIEKHTKQTRQEVIAEHTSRDFRVYMLGFVPGFVYLGSLPPELQVTRLTQPRRHVPRGSVAIAGWQTGIYPSVVPGGWNILGRTPMPLLNRKDFPISPFEAGDYVRFSEVSLSTYSRMTTLSSDDIQKMLSGR
ncbi:MAG: 5-oxoprolinase subunit PxpB [Saprospiraceae bacterium]|nr:5-oxoprolinase subunit PxpB [Saprospiraceae bacterium]